MKPNCFVMKVLMIELVHPRFKWPIIGHLIFWAGDEMIKWHCFFPRLLFVSEFLVFFLCVEKTAVRCTVKNAFFDLIFLCTKSDHESCFKCTGAANMQTFSCLLRPLKRKLYLIWQNTLNRCIPIISERLLNTYSQSSRQSVNKKRLKRKLIEF